MLVRDGQIKACAYQTGHNPSYGIASCGRSNETRQNIVSRTKLHSLRYIENQDKRFQTFVANRVATIHNSSSPPQWNYVNTELNTADDASRGVPANSLKRWIQGPEFLCQSTEAWPKRPAEMNVNVDEADLEVKSPIVCASHDYDPNPVVRMIERYSSWNRRSEKNYGVGASVQGEFTT